MENTVKDLYKIKEASMLPIYVCHVFSTETKNLGEFDLNPSNHCLYIRRKGRVLIFHRGKRQTLHESRGILLKAGEAYHFKESKLIDGGGWILLFTGDYCEKILDYLGYHFFEAFDLEMTRIRHMQNEIVSYMSEQKNELYKASLVFQEMLYSVARYRNEMCRGDIKMWEVSNYIHHHYCENITLEELSKVYGTSQSYFTRAYKAVYHRPPMQAVKWLRHEKSKRLLEETDKKIYDISKECGFDNCDYFCAVFKKAEGMTPAKYRREKKLKKL